MRHTLGSHRIITTFVVILALLGAGLGVYFSQARTQASSSSGVLNYPNVGTNWPATFDPANVQDSQSIMVISMLYGNLVKLNSQNQIVPDLASAWTISSNRKVYTFHLRAGAKFSNGKPVTAADVIYSIDRTLNPKAFNGQAPSPVANTYLGSIQGATSYTGKGQVAGLQAVNSHTVRITLSSPISFFLQTLSYPTADIVPAGTPVGGLTTTNPMANQVSSGPWRIASYSYKNSLTFVPNTGYYNYSKMKLKKVVMPFVGDVNTAYQGYQSGQYAMAPVPSSLLVSARTQSDFHSSPILAIDYITYNVSKPPFNNKDLRLALSYAINRGAINQGVLHGAQKTIYSIVPAGIPGYDANGQGHVPGYNPALARKYLALAKQQMGTSFPSSLTIDYQSTSPDIASEYTQLQYDWQQIGLNVHIQAIPFNTWLSQVAKPTTSLTYTSGPPWTENLWIDDFPDAEDFTTNLLGPTSQYNVGNYNNPQFEALISRALTAPASQRPALYIQASRIALNDAAWSMIGQQTTNWRWSPSIHGVAVWSSTSNPYPVNNDWTNVSVQ